MATDRPAVLAVPGAAALLLWPALWNGYPIVFADTGTYLSQAIHRYAGWDRPVFYSLFMLPLYGTMMLWPVVMAQALLAAWVLWLTCRVLGLVPGQGYGAGRFLLLVAFLSVGTWLPWITSELMPDLFTPLLILVLCLLGWAPEALSVRERVVLTGLASFFIAAQQSSVPLSVILALVSLIARCALAAVRLRVRTAGRYSGWWQTGPRRLWRGERFGARVAGWPNGRPIVLPFLPPLLAVLMLCTVNLAAHGRFAVSPFGNVFLLARVMYDGPGMAVLRRDCPRAGWRLCPYLDQLPATSDDFLWRADGPLYLAGGPKLVAGDAGAIIAAAVRADPLGEARQALANSWAQLVRFDSGDGLQAWPEQVSGWVARDFPAFEYAHYQAARQQNGRLAVPKWLGTMHRITGIGGVVGCVVLLVALWRERGGSGAGGRRGGAGKNGLGASVAHRPGCMAWWRGHWVDGGIGSRSEPMPGHDGKDRACSNMHLSCPPNSRVDCGKSSRDGGRAAGIAAGFVVSVLLSLPVSAGITGALSAPHERYQSRIMWLPPFVALAALGRSANVSVRRDAF